MDSKLKLLFEQIKLEEKYENKLIDAKLEKIIVNNDKSKWSFIIKSKRSIKIDTYFYIEKKLKDFYNDIKEVTLIIKVINIDYSLMKEYYNDILEVLIIKSRGLEVFRNRDVFVEDNKLIIETFNKGEKILFDKVKKKIINFYKDCGFEKIELEIIVNEQKGEDVRKEIELETTSEIILKDTKKNKVVNKIILGGEIKSRIINISDILGEEDNATVEVQVFGLDCFESSKSDFKIITLKITDSTDSIYAKIFLRDEDEYKRLKKEVKIGNWYKIRGYIKNDKYSNDLVLNIRDINVLEKKDEVLKDESKEKRVELHTHTFMSQMDGVVGVKKLINQALNWGHKAIAITDHNGVQSFPDAYHLVCDINSKLKDNEQPFKVIYGAELVMVDDSVDLVIRPNDSNLIDNTYVVFDFETTGFNAGGGDSIIEVGAVKIHNGEIIDRFSELINPGRKLPQKIIDITNITDEMLKDKSDEKTVIKKFIDWFSDLPMVAHNAKFDVSFLEMAYNKYNLGNFTNTVIDTLELSRVLDSNFSRHSLSALVKRYEVPWDESAHHRADYDAEGTAYVFHKMLNKLVNNNIEKLNEFDKLISKEEVYKYGKSYHINILVKNKIGLKNLFKIISLANTKYLYKTPRILRSEIIKHREGLLIGSGCYESEVFIQARSKSDEELSNVVKFYDYVEIQPIDCYDHLLQLGDFPNKRDLVTHIEKIVKTVMETGAIMIATGDVHHLTKEDKIYREIIVNQKVPGGGRHPLAKKNIHAISSNHLRTTEEMLSNMEFLGKDIAQEIVIDNPNIIADMVDIIEVIIETGGIPFSPKIDNSVEIVNELVYSKAKELYGDPLPNLIKERIEQELSGIIKGGFDVIYLISQKLVKKSNDDGYLVGSRGSVGSSFVATMMGITEVNPLPAHYVCPKCKHTIFEEDGIMLAKNYSSGYDLPDKVCPKCNGKMKKDGQDMPFATFLGFDADKVPDIDLNFSGDYQWKAHEYTKELFGIDNVYRAGTIGTVAEKTAFGFVKGYCDDKRIEKRNAEIERLALGCTGVKRTTGQHPGGIVVIPGYMDVYDFTPYQYPADDKTSLWRTTHFDYHAIDQDVLKLDILGHDDPTVLKMLQDLSGIDITSIPFDDNEVMKIFSSPEVLGVSKEDIMCETGTLGIPEFGTKFVVGMLMDTHPKTFSELLKISGLSHGTDVWLGNAQELIRNNIVEFKDVIGCRDDIMVYLMYNGVDSKLAFKIMEFVRKGKPSKDIEGWEKFVAEMKQANIPDWYIDSCQKIKYMFPKAHAAAYVMSAIRIAWFKVHYPIYYYCAYLSIRCADFDIETMIKGYQSIKNKIIEITNKGYLATNKETSILGVLEIALEMTARGFRFGNIDLKKSHSINFIIDEDNKTLIPPFRTIDGLGDTVAENIIKEREKGDFLSIEDLQRRGKISQTLIEKLRLMGMLEELPESSQLSLF